MRIESSGHSRGNPRLFELVENAPKTGKSPTVWAWPELMDYLKIAGQPVPGPWPPHQEPRPDPEEDSLPVAVAEPPEDIRRPEQARVAEQAAVAEQTGLAEQTGTPEQTPPPTQYLTPTPHDETPPQLGETPSQRDDHS